MAIEYLKQDDPSLLLAIRDTPIVLDFTSSSCAPCLLMVPEVESFAAHNPDIPVFSINADYYPVVAAKFRVRIFPMMHLVYNGESIAITAGLLDEAAITEFVENALANI